MDRYPAVRLFLSLAAGILIGDSVDIPVLFSALGLASAAAAAAIWGRSRAGGWLWLLVLSWSGCLWHGVRVRAAEAPVSPGRQSALMLVSGEPRLSNNRWIFTGSVEAVGNASGGWSPAGFKASVYLPADLGLEPGYGDRMRVEGDWRLAGPSRNPGGFDYRQYLEHQEVAGILASRQAALVGRTGGNQIMAGLIIPARKHVRSAVSRYLEGDEAALLLGLLLGERHLLSDRVKDAFSGTGTTHVLAVSGLHVALVALILFTMLRVARVPRRASYLAAMAGLALYAALTGGSASIVRAAIMSCAVMLGMLFERQGSGLNMLGLSGMLILSFWPQAIFTVGFQLSFAATFGILTMTGPVQNLLFKLTGSRAVRHWVLTPLAVSAAAQLATTPFLAWHFHRVPLVSLAANLVVVPLAGMVLAQGIAMSLAALISHHLAALLAASAYGASWLLLKSVDLFAGLGAASVSWPRPDQAQIAVYALGALLLFNWSRPGRWRMAAIGACLALANLIVWRQALAAPPRLEVHYLDVGQGDAAVIVFPNGRVLAIDAGMGGPGFSGGGGYDYGRRVVVPFLRYRGIGRIDRMLITHADADHCGGLRSVLELAGVKRLTVTHHHSGKKLYREALETAVRKGVRLDSLCGYDTLDGIWPARGFLYSRPDTMENGNETSLVCYIEYGRHSYFFTGDMGPELEGHLFRQGLLPSCTVLKVPHHGARHNNGPKLARLLGPEAAVFSAGEFNRFGHPHPQALENYSNVGASLYRTDLCGAVTVTSDGERYQVGTMLGD
ncbi:MAG TPA: DNA internalization-related competence protein ComEC/Rec2 [candidate division Zixibacteria bacterium]|nr:DNA internalization-related competence protein ComEC/Rec2 [candidate division Zixibacteria bacterium]